MMQRFFTLIFFLINSLLFANVTVYFNYGVFNAPSSKPYLETYLTISGNSVKFSPSEGGYQASINVSWKILKGTEVVKASNYNLMSPKVSDTLHPPSFIDNQRFSLENGQYTLELVVSDNAFPDKKTTHIEKISILYKRDKQIYSSDIQILESFSKTSTPSVTSKNGYELIPYNINYFPKTQNTLKFYIEAYNTDTVLGKKSKFVYSYYIENSESLFKQKDLVGFQKQHANTVNPLLAQLDITQLTSGNYNLVVEVKDSVNIIHLQKKWFFQRQSDSKIDLSIVVSNEPKKVNTVEEFFNSYQSKDTLKQFVECLWPRSSIKEREWQQTQIVKKDPNLMRSYLVDYWKAEAGDSLDPLKTWMTYYQSVLEADALLKCGKQKGYYTDRGRVYLQYGKPNQRNQVNSEPNTYPYEIWQYYRLYDKATGRFFTNKKFVFVNFAIADNCYQLIHSDVKGEMYDERWKFKIMNRSQQSNNLDETNPNKTYGSNIDENFNNPR
jgi:GWxTD domain-containing protein